MRKAFTQPSRSDVHIVTALGHISIAYLQSVDSFVAGRVFPGIPVAKQSDSYFTYDRGEFNRDEMEERAPATESAGGTYTISNETYFAKDRAFHHDIPDRVRDNADSAISLDREATQLVTYKGLINREVNWKNAFFPNAHAPGAIWTFDFDGDASRSAALSPTDAANNNIVFWDLPASTPIEDIRLAKRIVQESTGFRPNTLTLGRGVFDTLIDHPDIIARLDRGQTPVGPAMTNKAQLAALFELDDILIMDAIQNLANQGQAASHSFIGGKNALLSYKPSTPGLMTPSAGYTFNWGGRVGSGPDGMRIRRMRIDLRDADRIEIDMNYDQKLTSADLGFYFNLIVQ